MSPNPETSLSRRGAAALFGGLLLLQPGGDLLAQYTVDAFASKAPAPYTSSTRAIDAYAAEGFHSHQSVVLFLGGTTETKRGKPSVETGFAAGVEWTYRFAQLWSIGAVVEAVGKKDIVRDVMVLVPVSVWPWEGLRIVAGPGLEFAESKTEFVFRAGTGYEFVFGERFIVAPEFFVDWIGADKITYVYGVALGLEF